MVTGGLRFLVVATSVASLAGGAEGAEVSGARAVEASIAYTADVIAVLRGGNDASPRYLDNLDLVADGDLERLVGWKGARAHVYLVNNLGRRPNDAAGTLQGLDNIEVPQARLRLYEAWIEQDLGHGAGLLLGLFDLNSEFYVTDSSGLLLAPAFGIGTELAATGSNGPSIFPSTALAARLRLRLGGQGYVRIALFNARAGVPGDDGGVDFSFDEGLLMIAEAGLEGRGKLAFGAWRYSLRQDDLRQLDPAGDPLRRRGQGVYMAAEYPLMEDGTRILTAFFRGGVTDGRTTFFTGSWQAGLLVEGVIAGRPDSQLSLGVAQAGLSRRFRYNLRDAGMVPSRTETGFELTFSDRLAPFLVVQPDLQYVRHPGGNARARDVIAGGVRITFEF